jgi:Holliday junction resolvase-like predicted endonuclease
MKVSSRHIGVAAEAAAAALFARIGYDVSVQYGANQPEYDLIVARGESILKVSVKGSQDGGWGLSQSTLVKGTADYHGAAETWRLRHTPRTILCLVQYKEVGVDQMPRVYLATPAEVAARLRSAAKGRGDTILHERHTWAPNAYGAGTTEEIPADWLFTERRVEALLAVA